MQNLPILSLAFFVTVMSLLASAQASTATSTEGRHCPEGLAPHNFLVSNGTGYVCAVPEAMVAIGPTDQGITWTIPAKDAEATCQVNLQALKYKPEDVDQTCSKWMTDKTPRRFMVPFYFEKAEESAGRVGLRVRHKGD